MTPSPLESIRERWRESQVNRLLSSERTNVNYEDKIADFWLEEFRRELDITISSAPDYRHDLAEKAKIAQEIYDKMIKPAILNKLK